MTGFKDFVPQGVMPAGLIAFDSDFAIDAAETGRHPSVLAPTRGISAITVNGRASAARACSFKEQARLSDIASDGAGAPARRNLPKRSRT